MRKYILALCALVLIMPAWADDQVMVPLRTELNGKPVLFAHSPIMLNDRVLVPVRGIFEAMGGAVTFEPMMNTITCTRADRVVVITLGSNRARVNGQEVVLDVPAFEMGDTTMVPLRFASENLGVGVVWKPLERTVVLNSELPVHFGAPPVPIPPQR